MSLVNNKNLVRHLRQSYLIYLGLLPSLATLAVLWQYGYKFPFLLFIGGIVAVSVYLVATYSYTHLPTRLLPMLFFMLDGPFFAFLSMRSKVHPLGFAIETYLIDGTDIWLSILILALVSPLPTSGQRIGSVFFMAVAVAMTTSLFWPYITAELWGQPRAIWLLLGLGTAVISQFITFKQENMARTDDSSGYLIGLLILWLGAMFAGLLLHHYAPPL
ncbi:MAG: hypothetical protein R3E31_22145 [Chloroflexota bacterium]